MPFPAVYLSRPAARLPETRLSNADLLARIRANFRGTPEDFAAVEAAVTHVFTKMQFRLPLHRGESESANGRLRPRRRPAGSRRQRHFPERGRAFDLRAAFRASTSSRPRRWKWRASWASKPCGPLMSPRPAPGRWKVSRSPAASMAIDPKLDYALICSAELTRHFLSYDIQSPEEMITKSAGLTIGHAATAILLARTPFKGGSARLLGNAHALHAATLGAFARRPSTAPSPRFPPIFSA